MCDLLADTAAVVTGAAAVNGRGIIIEFAKYGFDVVVADVRTEPRERGALTHEYVQAETDARARYVLL